MGPTDLPEITGNNGRTAAYSIIGLEYAFKTFLYTIIFQAPFPSLYLCLQHLQCAWRLTLCSVDFPTLILNQWSPPICKGCTVDTGHRPCLQRVFSPTGDEEQNPRTSEAKIVQTSFRAIWSSRPVATPGPDSRNTVLCLWNEGHVFLNV